MKRTAAVELNEDFEYVCDVTKAWTDPTTGRRIIRGVASGIAEDRAGERVSRAAIAKMAATPLGGDGVALTSGHDQDWLTEFGRVDKLQHDREHDELVYEASLPPAGEDPIADKAWRELTVNGRKLGVSIGGKLKKAYHELVDGPGGVRKRKVLDEVLLRHLALTQKPCYTGTFAEAVAKTWTGDAPATEAFVLDVEPDEPVAKAVKPDEADDEAAQGDAPASAEQPDGDTPPEDGQEQPAAATAEAPSDAEDAQDLPMARHLSCPNCGHEFAAPMDETAPDDSGDDTDPNEDDGEARKSHPDQEDTMDLNEAVAKLRTLADTEAADVTKTEKTGIELPADGVVREVELVEKTDELGDVVKMLAASHAHNDGAIADVKTATAQGFEVVAKAITDLTELVRSLPTGRKSVARVLPTRDEVAKSDTETDTVEKRIENAETAVDALKALNEHTYGIR